MKWKTKKRKIKKKKWFVMVLDALDYTKKDKYPEDVVARKLNEVQAEQVVIYYKKGNEIGVEGDAFYVELLVKGFPKK